MGDPTTMAVMQGVKGFAEYQEKRTQESAQQARFEQNRIAATQARDLKIQSLNQRAIQESEVASEKKMQSQLDAMRAVERAKVAAGEAGVSGSTVDMLLNDYEAQRLRAATTINANLENIEKQIELQKLGASSEAESRINSIRQGRQPSFLAAAVGTAASAAGAYQSYNVKPTAEYKPVFGTGYYDTDNDTTRFGFGNDNEFE